jgi:glycosyltransferase involved in cell wall biosynthesis
MVVGIDATNLRQGGGLTHLVEMLGAADPVSQGIRKVIICGDELTLDALDDQSWLYKTRVKELMTSNFHRFFWRQTKLVPEFKHRGIDILFVPGGGMPVGFAPFVTMSRNMLPFELRELRRYGLSFKTLRLFLLRWIQQTGFRHAAGTIFLTNYATNTVQQVTGRLPGLTCIIPHGLSARFRCPPRPQRSIGEYSSLRPYRFVYVSIIDIYKHQWAVIEGIATLRKAGLPVELHLAGPAYGPAMRKLKSAIAQFDPDGSWVHCHGSIPYEKLHKIYMSSDAGIFASSCENMPNILLETMAAGLPIACSNRGPMPEILGEAGVYFDPELPSDIARALREMIVDPELRQRLCALSYRKVKEFSWERCAERTFGFLAEVNRRFHSKICAAS